MALQANEYPPKWETSNEYPSPPQGVWFPAEIRVAAFFSIFCNPQFFNRIVIWMSHPKCLMNHKAYKIDKKTGYRVITVLEKALGLRYAIENSCIGAGHMSILFVPNNADEFSSLVRTLKHYGNPKTITIGTGSKEDPLNLSLKQDIKFLESNLFHAGEHIFTFSHDAEYLYEIFR